MFRNTRVSSSLEPRHAARRRENVVELLDGRGRAATAQRPFTTWRDDLVASLFATVLVAGLFIDGWAHIKFRAGRLGPFFTPWHGILYTGFTLTAVWIATRNQRVHERSVSKIPQGYGLAFIGFLLAPIAIGGDAIWHTVFGVEEGLSRLLAPFHLFLFASALLVVTAPLRATTARLRHEDRPGLVAYLPAAISLTLSVAMISFFLQWISPVVDFYKPLNAGLGATAGITQRLELLHVIGLMVTAIILVTPLVVLARRQQPPFGTGIILFTGVVALDSAITQLHHASPVLAAAIGGLAADVLIAKLRPSATRHAAMRTMAALTAGAFAASYFLTQQFVSGVAWPLDLWMGSAGLAGLTGLMLAYVANPVEVPLASVTSITRPETVLERQAV